MDQDLLHNWLRVAGFCCCCPTAANTLLLLQMDCSEVRHGTSVAGVAAAGYVPGAPMMGVAPEAQLGVYKVSLSLLSLLEGLLSLLEGLLRLEDVVMLFYDGSQLASSTSKQHMWGAREFKP